MRIFWWSNAAWTHTGYGNQTALFWWRIQKYLGHKVILGANYGLQGATLNIETEGEETTVYPLAYERHGNDIIAPHARHVGADIVITLYDAWCFRPDVMSRLRWLPWLPVDSEPLPDSIKEAILVAWKPIAYSRFGERMMRNAGLDPAYVPHGIDTAAYRPLHDKAGARGRLGLPEDKFIAVMVAANKGLPSRKSFPEVFDAWAQFTKGRSDCLLYLHTHPGPETLGMDLPTCSQKYGIDKDAIIFCDPYYNVLGYPAKYMCDLYNAADVLLSPSQGEGFGLPIVEAQACGCPVIVGDWTSMPELCFSGWLVHGQRIYTPQAAWQYVPAVDEILWAIEQAYNDRDRSGVAERAREGAMEYDADRVLAEYWKPLLEDVEAEIAESSDTALETLDLSA